MNNLLSLKRSLKCLQVVYCTKEKSFITIITTIIITTEEYVMALKKKNIKSQHNHIRETSNVTCGKSNNYEVRRKKKMFLDSLLIYFYNKNLFFVSRRLLCSLYFGLFIFSNNLITKYKLRFFSVVKGGVELILQNYKLIDGL